MLCKQGRESEASITAEAIKNERKKIANVSDRGTRPYHIASEMVRFEAARLMDDGVDASSAYSIVQEQHTTRQK